jgi:hypothetical protein
MIEEAETSALNVCRELNMRAASERFRAGALPV